MTRSLQGFWLGERPYAPTFALMEALFEARRHGSIDDVVLFLEHPAVITLGRGAHSENILESADSLKSLGVDVVETGRGGDVTLHAPGQLIAYPIVDLKPDRCDVRKYVQSLMRVMNAVTTQAGVSGGSVSEMIGLWVDAESPHVWPGEEHAKSRAKVGAIGVRISRWITSHGFALNLSTDLNLFRLIIPCGIANYPVTSVAQLLSHDLSHAHGTSPPREANPILTTRAGAEVAYPALAAELGATLSGPLIELSGADPNALLEIISLRARSAAGS